MKTVLVTAVGSFAGEAVIRLLKGQGVRVLGCDIYPAEWVVNARDADLFFQAPYASQRDEYLDFVWDICEREGVDGVIPLTDTEVDVLNDSRFREQGSPALLISGQRTIGLCRDKSKSEAYLRSLGIGRPIPGISLNEAGAAALDYPVVVKPKNGRSSQNLRTIEQPDALRYLQQEMRAEAGNYLVQKKLAGDVITVDVVRDPRDGATVCLPRRELLRTGTGAGLTVEVFYDPVLEDDCRQIAGALGVCGCVNFEFIEDQAGVRHFLECNPRFAGGVAFSCLAGYDMVKNHLRCFTGEGIEKQPEISRQFMARRYTEYQMKIGELL